MQLIEKEVILQAIKHLRDVYQLRPHEYYEGVHCNNPTANALRHIEKKVVSAPSAYSAQHSHWIMRSQRDYNNNAQYECANCHAGDIHCVSQAVPFCWKCGCIMNELETIDINSNQNIIFGIMR